jgi:hypothetical protein
MMAPASALVALYFGVFCFPLSILTILTSSFMLAKPQRLLFRVLFKILLLIVVIYCLLKIQDASMPAVEAVQKSVLGFSPHLNSVLLLLFLQGSL